MNDIYVTKSSMPSYEDYIEAIKPLWESHWLTNMGKYHRELEERLKDYLKVDGLSLMVNGHMALELTIQSFDFPEGSEIITTPFTFISTTHAIIRNRLKPVFCDVNYDDGTIDVDKIRELITEKTVAIVPVHVYGNICNYKEIDAIAKEYGLKVIYDAAHAFGIQKDGMGVGALGDASVFSFHATKVYNTIEGGAACFSDPNIYEKLFNLKNFGIRGEEEVVSVGANAKMNEFSAIMGILNLEHIDDAIREREIIKKEYNDTILKIPGVRFLGNPTGESNHSYYPIIIGNEYPLSRDELYKKFKLEKIHVRKYFYPLTSDYSCFKGEYKNKKLDVARDLSKRVLVLPIYEGMSQSEIDRVTKVMTKTK